MSEASMGSNNQKIQGLINFKDKTEFHAHVGELGQICGFKEYRFEGGKAHGMRAIDVWTGSGLTFTVLIDSGMDISYCHYNGIPIGHISKTGIVHPSLHEIYDMGFLRSFSNGLLTTCGMSQQGGPGEWEGEKLPMHGRITHTPANLIHAKAEWVGDDYQISIKGVLKESMYFHENLVMTREIVTSLFSKEIKITDRIENENFDRHPIMMLYHFNFGFPVVSKNSKLTVEDCEWVPRDAEAEKGVAVKNSFQNPTEKYQEQVFLHNAFKNPEAFHKAAISNPDISKNFAAYVKFKPSQLGYLIQWKQMGQKDYVCGLEPATNPPFGRAAEAEAGRLEYIEPFEERIYETIVGVED